MHPNEQVITRFYEAFARRDAETMAACYHRDVEFSDPVFPDLKAGEAGDMWRMLTTRATDLAIRFNVKSADDKRGAAHWDADYTFTLFAILFVFVGAQFLAFGLLGEYIGRIYVEVRDRPRYMVKKVHTKTGPRTQ